MIDVNLLLMMRDRQWEDAIREAFGSDQNPPLTPEYLPVFVEKLHQKLDEYRDEIDRLETKIWELEDDLTQARTAASTSSSYTDQSSDQEQTHSASHDEIA